MSVLLSTTIRYLRIAFKYKFEIVVDAGYLVAWMISFGFIGEVFMGAKAGLPGGDYTTFILVNILFWAFMEKGYLEGTRVIPEEARMGTLGTLMNNNVCPLSLITGQMIARSLVNAVIAVAVFLPIFTLVVELPPLTGIRLGYLTVVIFLSWFYVLAVTILIGSLALMFKKIGSTAGVLLQVLKVGSGFFFPVATFGDAGGIFALLPGLLRILPVTTGLETAQRILILGELPPVEDALVVISGISFDPILMMIGGVVAGMLVSVFFYRYVERKSMEWGMIEHY